MTDSICPIMSFRKNHASYEEDGKHQLVRCYEECEWYDLEASACAIWALRKDLEAIAQR